MSDLRIAVVLYDGMTTPDAIGPTEMLRFLPGARVELVAETAGPVATDTDGVQLVTEYDPPPPHDAGSLDKATSDVVRRAAELGRPQGAIPEFWEPPR